MHTDEQKKFDIRNIERNVKNGIITQRDYEIYLSKLPDASVKIFNPEESSSGSKDLDFRKGTESQSKKREVKKKGKVKG